jgi:hypothetical protein
MGCASPFEWPLHPGLWCHCQVNGVPRDGEIVKLLPADLELGSLLEADDDVQVGKPLVMLEIPDSPGSGDSQSNETPQI